MKTILGSQVVNVWAAGTQDIGFNRSHGNLFFKGDAIYSYGTHFPFALRLPWGFLINGDTHSNTTAKHQAGVRHVIRTTGRPSVIVPFSSLRSAGISYADVLLVDREPDRILPITRSRGDRTWVPGLHLMGRSVIMANGTYYLSGLDETMRDPWHGHFLAQLPCPAATVSDALEALKPAIVRNAEATPVKRQGEWFFIPVDKPLGIIQHKWLLVNRDPARRKAHRATYYISPNYVSGTIRHLEGDHKMLTLGKQWYMAYENTEIRSFRGGRVD